MTEELDEDAAERDAAMREAVRQLAEAVERDEKTAPPQENCGAPL